MSYPADVDVVLYGSGQGRLPIHNLLRTEGLLPSCPYLTEADSVPFYPLVPTLLVIGQKDPKLRWMAVESNGISRREITINIPEGAADATAWYIIAKILKGCIDFIHDTIESSPLTPLLACAHYSTHLGKTTFSWCTVTWEHGHRTVLSWLT